MKELTYSQKREYDKRVSEALKVLDDGEYEHEFKNDTGDMTYSQLNEEQKAEALSNAYTMAKEEVKAKMREEFEREAIPRFTE